MPFAWGNTAQAEGRGRAEGYQRGSSGCHERCRQPGKADAGHREDLLALAQLSVERLPGLKSGKGHTLKAKQGRVWWYLDPDCHTDTRHPNL